MRLCFCVCVFVFVFVLLRGCVFVWLCFCVFSACVCVFVFFCVCVFVFVVKAPPFAREAAEGGNGGSNPQGHILHVSESWGGGARNVDRTSGPWGRPRRSPVRYHYTTATCFASISRWGLAFFWALVQGLWPSGRSSKPLCLQIPRRLLQPGSRA